MAADGAVDQLRAARAAFHSACAATTPITCMYTLNLAYACAALGEWAEAAEALESALVNGPDWLSTTKLIQDWKTDLRRKEIQPLRPWGAVISVSDASSKQWRLSPRRWRSRPEPRSPYRPRGTTQRRTCARASSG